VRRSLTDEARPAEGGRRMYDMKRTSRHELPLLSIAVLLLVLTGAGAEALAQSSAPLGLSEAAAIALDRNPMSEAATAGRRAAGAAVQEARATWFPQIDVSTQFVRSDNPVFVFASLLEQGRFGPEHFDPVFLNDPDPLKNYRTALNIRYPVFDQFRRWSANGQARIGRDQADTQVDQVRQQLRFETIRAYYGAMVAEAAKGVADEAVATAEAQVSRMRDSYETGLIVQSDLLSGEVQLADFRQRQIDAAGQYRIAHAGLDTVLGQPGTGPRPLSGVLGAVRFTLPPEEELLRSAIDARPDTRRARLSREAAKLQARAAAGQFLPRLDGFATVGASGSEITTSGRDTMVGAVVTLNIHQPGRAARLAQARAGEAMADAELRRIENQVRFEIVEARERFTAASERVGVAARAAEQASEALRIVRDRYAEGLTTITEVLRAETAAVEARMRLLAARSEEATGYAGVLLAAGRLNSVTEFEPAADAAPRLSYLQIEEKR
jgi:outer membrane protein